MDYETIVVERRDNIGIIKLNRPRQRNAMNAQLVTELIDALRELDDDPLAHVVIITSAVPGVFCAGRDLAEGSSALAADVAQQREISSRPPQIWLTIRSMKKVVIGAVSGWALAGGCGLAASCDLVIAAEDAVFGLPEINVGLFPCTVGPRMRRDIIGLKRCFEFFFTGERIDAQEARQIGLVNKVVPTDKLEESAMELAQKIASKSPFVLRIGKQFFYNMQDMEYTQAVRYATEVITMLASSPDGMEGQRAFKEKRKPQWRDVA